MYRYFISNGKTMHFGSDNIVYDGEKPFGRIDCKSYHSLEGNNLGNYTGDYIGFDYSPVYGDISKSIHNSSSKNTNKEVDTVGIATDLYNAGKISFNILRMIVKVFWKSGQFAGGKIYDLSGNIADILLKAIEKGKEESPKKCDEKMFNIPKDCNNHIKTINKTIDNPKDNSQEF